MDRVKVRCNGGISALSAFFNGYGSSMAIDLPMEVTVTSGGRERHDDDDPVSRTIDLLRRRFDVPEHFSVHVSSRIPGGRGLKSSSALTLSIIAGFLRINGIKLEDSETLALGAELSIANGTSSTGAYDDLCSAFYGGICLTDNRKRELILRKEVRENSVLVGFDEGRRLSAEVDLRSLSGYSNHAQQIRRMVEEGRYYEAMSFNGSLLGNIYGQNSWLILRLLSLGADFSAQCGKGPAVFGIFRSDKDASDAMKELEGEHGVQLKKTSFSNSTIKIE